MSTDKYTGPWLPGMLTTDGQRIVVVEGAWVVAVRYDWIRQGGTGYDRWCIDSELGRGMRPDLGDDGTVGALAGVVRDLLGRPFLETQVGAGGNFYIADFAPENEPQESPDWPTMRTDGTFGNNLKPEVCGMNRGLAWLAAYHAHPSVASSASPPVRGDATDLGGA